ncbi:GntR family transcriptional regulator [Peribacillus alkalitolerans]|uniref:GntR family transcriptional regulator n=1 Tax=Peribacillus alkalitolerans TaxID=1550385 RepID=UPI0013D6C1D2|nr:GntR family transcriptional regulator [Peribacillus alkalitolerans]
MKQESVKIKSSDKIKRKMVKAILEKEFPIGSNLPSERELAVEFGVGRPTIREALQQLIRDGWIKGNKGLPATVNDFWQTGNLTTLEHIIEHHDSVPDEFVVYLLEVRASLSPSYVKDAIMHNQPKAVALLAYLDQLIDEAESYAHFDWQLQKGLVRLSPNPVYLLILNSFNSFYLGMAKQYFSEEQHRITSRQYYNELLQAALKGESEKAGELARRTMVESINLWKNRKF